MAALICRTCGDYGMSPQCPKCGKVTGSIQVESLDHIQKAVEGIKTYTPKEYGNVIFDADKLKNSHMDLVNNEAFLNYCTSLHKMYEHITKGLPLPRSVLIYAPQNFSKQHWVYAAQQAAIKSSMSVIPYMDLLEMKRLIDCYESRAIYDDVVKYYAGVTDMSIYDADLCIIKVPVGVKYLEAYRMMLLILDRRGRRGKNTIFISRYSLAALTELDTFGDFKSCFNLDNNKTKNLVYIPYIRNARA